MAEVKFPLDTTGKAIGNLITNELHTVTESNYRDYYFIVPNFAPIFVDNFRLTININGEIRELIEGIDYNFALPYIAAIRSLGKPIYGAITLNKLDPYGILKFQYQTLGGEWIVNRLHVLSHLAEKVYNPRTTIWDIVTDKPEIFPPIPHYQDYDSFYGQEEVVHSLNDIARAILNGDTTTTSVKHLTNINNPHKVTKEQVGLGNVLNFPLATDTEVINHVPVDKYITLRQLLLILSNTNGISTSYNLVTDKYTYNNNDIIEVTFDTIGVPEGKKYYWYIEHLTTSINDFQTLNGEIIVNNLGTNSFTILTNPLDREGSFEFIIKINVLNTTGSLVAQTSQLTYRNITNHNELVIAMRDAAYYTENKDYAPVDLYLEKCNIPNRKDVIIVEEETLADIIRRAYIIFNHKNYTPANLSVLSLTNNFVI